MNNKLTKNLPAAFAGFILATLFVFWVDFALQKSWVVSVHRGADTCHQLP